MAEDYLFNHFGGDTAQDPDWGDFAPQSEITRFYEMYPQLERSAGGVAVMGVIAAQHESSLQ